MTILSTFKKKEKMSMKYFLRKDYISNSLSKTESEKQLFQLYVEFVFRRRPNKCKSLWTEFIQKDSILFDNLKNEFYSNTLGYSFSGVSERVFSLEVQNFVNRKSDLMPHENNDFIRLLIYEKYHAEALFTLFRDLDEDKFSMSKFGAEYKSSIIFVYDLFEVHLKEKLLNEFYHVLPRFPQIFSSEISFEKLSMSIFDIISIIDVQYVNNSFPFKNFCLLLNNFSNIIREYLCNSNERISANGLTLPIWFCENHSSSFTKFLEQRLSYLSNDERELLFEIVKIVDGQLVDKKKSLFEKFA